MWLLLPRKKMRTLRRIPSSGRMDLRPHGRMLWITLLEEIPETEIAEAEIHPLTMEAAEI